MPVCKFPTRSLALSNAGLPSRTGAAEAIIMSERVRVVLNRVYARAERPEQLPWHREEPPQLLVQALEQRAGAGTALDLGCGAGTYSLYMARRGYQVTAVDFMPQAVAMASGRAAAAGLNIRVVQADVTTWDEPGPFDVVLDVGCLHGLAGAQRQAYRRQVLRWLAPGGDYVLAHFGRGGWWDWWPIGPRRASRAELIRFFAPDLAEHAYETEALRMPLLMGGRGRACRYWFRRR
jgi:SAM-dependent methyltransferase